MIKAKIALAALAIGLISTLVLLAPLATADSPAARARVGDDVGGTHSASSLSALDPTSPTLPVRLVFIHHSTGGIWLADDYGGLGLALRDNNYFVSATNYGWGPDSIGDRTDIGNWWEWFRGPNSATYLAALYAESDKNVGDFGDYSRLATNPDPAGENQIIVFKSCFPNSLLKGSLSDPVPPIDSNPLRGQDAYSEYHTVANAKGIYIDLLNYFRTRPDKLFVVIAAPPVSDGTYADNARAFNNWLVNDWRVGYPLNNVAVFDYYNVLTTNGGDPNTNDLGWTMGNHHRWWNNAIQHKTDGGSNVLAYPTGDDHPSQAGDQKATAEFLPLLNIFYHQWKGGAAAPDLSASSKTASSLFATSGDRITYTVVIRSAAGPLSNTILLTDTIPDGLSYLPQTLSATVGAVNDSAAPTLRWSGLLTPTPIVTVTYAVTVNTIASDAITNSAIIVAPGYQPITRTASVFINGYQVYLPLIMSNYTSR